MPETHAQAPAARLEKWPDDQIHRVRVSERMLGELLAYGQTTTASSALVGPEVLVLETIRDAENAVGVPFEGVDAEALRALRALLEDEDAGDD